MYKLLFCVFCNIIKIVNGFFGVQCSSASHTLPYMSSVLKSSVRKNWSYVNTKSTSKTRKKLSFFESLLMISSLLCVIESLALWIQWKTVRRVWRSWQTWRCRCCRNRAARRNEKNYNFLVLVSFIALITLLLTFCIVFFLCCLPLI